MTGFKDLNYVLAKLAVMRSERIWPNALRYLWTEPLIRPRASSTVTS